MIPLPFLPIVVETSDLGPPSMPLRTDAETKALIQLPPERFRGDVNAEIHFVDPAKLYALCGMKVEIGKTLLGCARWSPRQLFLSNPCLSLSQLWATEACHELGHLNGWSEGHEK